MATVLVPTETCRTGNGNPDIAEQVMLMHAVYGACYFCCMDCNYENHHCHFCGERLNHNSTEGSLATGTLKLHYLKDCRPDLVDGSYYTERDLPIEPHSDGPMV